METAAPRWHAGTRGLEGMTVIWRTEATRGDPAVNGHRPAGPAGGEVPPQPSWRRPHARVRARVPAYAESPPAVRVRDAGRRSRATFAAVRGITYAIRHDIPPFHDVELGGTHLHHYIWGIGLISSVGGVAVYGDSDLRRHPVVGAAYGIGLALVVDELALLLELRDVYWQRQGRWSIDTGVSMIGTAGGYFVAMPFWHHLFRKEEQTRSLTASAAARAHAPLSGRWMALELPGSPLPAAAVRRSHLTTRHYGATGTRRQPSPEDPWGHPGPAQA